MEELAALLRNMPGVREAVQRRRNTANISDHESHCMEAVNALPGKLDGYDCPVCKNKGVVYILKDGYEYARRCECMDIRESVWRLKASGLEKLLERNRFDTFVCRSHWQETMKKRAEQFLENPKESWFFAGGQPGIGKTHICTALAAGFLEKGKSVRYMLWKDESAKLKAIVNEPVYEAHIRPWKECAVLYMDDLLKTPMDDFTKKRKPPSAGDINLAFEIINCRYNNGLTTIISSEHTIEGLMDIDEAIGSRIYERTKEYCLSFAPDRGKNQRLKV